MEAMKPRHAISQLEPSLCETLHQWLLELMLLLPQSLKSYWLSSALWLNFWSCFSREKISQGVPPVCQLTKYVCFCHEMKMITLWGGKCFCFNGLRDKFSTIVGSVINRARRRVIFFLALCTFWGVCLSLCPFIGGKQPHFNHDNLCSTCFVSFSCSFLPSQHNIWFSTDKRTTPHQLLVAVYDQFLV